MTLVHAEPSARWIWVTACAVLLLAAWATDTRASFAVSMACLLGAFASGLAAVRVPVHQVWADTETQALVLREAYLAGPRDQRLERAEIAALECVFLGAGGRETTDVASATYKLRVVMASGETIDLTREYEVPLIDGRLFRGVAPYQAAMTVRQALGVPIAGIDAWERPWRMPLA